MQLLLNLPKQTKKKREKLHILHDKVLCKQTLNWTESVLWSLLCECGLRSKWFIEQQTPDTCFECDRSKTTLAHAVFIGGALKEMRRDCVLTPKPRHQTRIVLFCTKSTQKTKPSGNRITDTIKSNYILEMEKLERIYSLVYQVYCIWQKEVLFSGKGN